MSYREQHALDLLGSAAAAEDREQHDGSSHGDHHAHRRDKHVVAHQSAGEGARCPHPETHG